jgi:hypothetical protein
MDDASPTPAGRIVIPVTLLRASLVLAASLFFGVSVVTTDPAIVLAASIVILISAAVVRMSVVAADAPAGVRATAHREPLSESPAPQHPSTPGRPMARAPGVATAT